MSNRQNQRKVYYYVGAAVILIGLIALLWLRYAATQKIIRNLGGGNLASRRAAAEELLRRGILADVLPAQPIALRIRAASALRGIAQHTDSKDLRGKAITQLMTMLKDPDDDVQRTAWVALGKVGVPALPFLRHRDRKNKDKDYSVLKEGDARAKQGGMDAFVVMASDAKVGILVADARRMAEAIGGVLGVDAVNGYLLWGYKRDQAAEAMAAAEPAFNEILRKYPSQAGALARWARSFREADEVKDDRVQADLKRILKRRVRSSTVDVAADYARTCADSVEAKRGWAAAVPVYNRLLERAGAGAAALRDTVETLREIQVSRLPEEGETVQQAEDTLDRILSVLGKAAADKDERDAADAVLGDLAIGKEPGRTQVPEALEPLMVMAWSKTDDNRKAALVALGERRISAGIEAALDAFKIEALQQAAIRALGNIGMIAYDRTYPARERESVRQRVSVAVEPIIAALKEPGLRSDAARALGRIRDPRAVAALAPQLGDREQEFWESVVGALSSIAAAPGDTGVAGVGALIAALKSDDARRREGAARALRGVAAPASLGPLTAALRDPEPLVRAKAAAALGWENNVSAIQPLIATLARDPDWQVTDSAIDALGEIGPLAIAPLIATLGRRSENEALPLHAERALLQIDATHPKAGRVLRTELIAATRNQNLDIVKWAAITLGDLGYSEEAAAILKRLGSSREEGLAWVAKEALREMGVEIE